jgi:hypothetical protein
MATVHSIQRPTVKALSVRPNNAKSKIVANMNEAVSKLESIISYHCTKDRTLLWEALQAAGSLNRMAGDREIIDGNKKLAALGDAVADHWLWLNLYQTKCTKGKSQHSMPWYGKD